MDVEAHASVDSNQFALYGLAAVIAAGIGFPLWALLRLELANDGAMVERRNQRKLAGCAAPDICSYKLPRKPCSRSIASNSALKLPLPKLRLPLR